MAVWKDGASTRVRALDLLIKCRVSAAIGEAVSRINPGSVLARMEGNWKLTINLFIKLTTRLYNRLCWRVDP